MMTASFENSGQTALLWTDAEGVKWSGIRCHVDGDAVVVDGVGQIQDAVREWLAAGGVPAPYVGPGLDAVKAEYCSRIEGDAEAARMQFLTAGVGMAMTYQEKFAQAQAVIGMGETAANAMSQAEREAQFPTLSASVGIEAATLWDCAEIVLERYTMFAQMSLPIERTRRAGKAAVAAASSEAEIVAIYESLSWPTP